MPSVSTQPAAASTCSTWLKPRTSSRRRATPSRSRKRFDVSLASPTGPCPSLSRAARASFFLECWSCGLFEGLFVEEAPAHGVVLHRDVALREHDLEKMREPPGRAEHLGAAVEIHAPDAAEALVELPGIERADPLPVAVEALGPDIQRERVVPAQVLHIEDLEPGLLHLDHHVGEARDPAAREHVLADEVVGLVVADVADEVDQAEAARLERARMRLNQVDQPIAAGVLEAADRDDLVVLPVHAAEVALERRGLAQPPPLDLATRVLDLRAGGVVAGHLHAEALLRVEQEAAEAAADVDHVVAGLEQHFLSDVLELVALRLLERARALLPVGAGVEHQGIIQPEAVELGPERVVELGVALGTQPARVGVQELVQAVCDAHQRV